MHIWIEVNTSVSSPDDDGINQGVDTVSYEEAVKLGGGAPMPLKLGKHLTSENGCQCDPLHPHCHCALNMRHRA
jgi:hypothetical protein